MTIEAAAPEVEETGAEPQDGAEGAPAESETTEASAEGGEGQGAPAAGEGEAKPRKSLEQAVKDGDIDEKTLSPSLRAALRVERKAKAMRADADAKLAQVEQRERFAQQREQQTQQQLKAWQEQVAPKLQRLEQIERAAQSPAALLRQFGHDPRAFVEALQDELANPVPAKLQQELEETRRWREEQAKREADEKAKREQQEAHQRAIQQDRAMVADALEIGGEATFPGLHKYVAEVSLEGLMADAYQVQQQMQQAGMTVTRASLLKELERRAAVHYRLGDAAPKPATSAQATDRGKPGNPATPAASGRGAPPRSVRQATATATAGDDENLSPEEMDRRAVARLKAARKAS